MRTMVKVHPTQFDAIMDLCRPGMATVRGSKGIPAETIVSPPFYLTAENWPAWAAGKDLYFTSSAPVRDLKTGEPTK